MTNTLKSLEQLQPTKNSRDEQYIVDCEAYKAGKKGYPTDPVDSLSESTTGRYRECYQMGYNTAEWENNNA